MSVEKSDKREENIALISYKGENRFPHKGKWNRNWNAIKQENIKKCYHCGKLGHL